MNFICSERSANSKCSSSESFCTPAMEIFSENNSPKMWVDGKWLKQQFNSAPFQDIHAQSTDVYRAKMSILLVLAGLFPPKRTSLEWNKNLNWQPVPYSYTAQSEDALVLMLTSCPRYHEELGRVFQEDLKETLDEYAEMFQELSNITGWNISSAADVASLYSTLKCEAISSVQLRRWFGKIHFDFSRFRKTSGSSCRRGRRNFIPKSFKP